MEEMLSHVRETFPLIEGKMIEVSKLIFEERIKMNCFYCGKYNANWKCPPKIPDIDFQRMLMEYENAAFLYICMNLHGGGVEGDYNMIRNDSSIYLHRALLSCEKWLYEHNNSTAISFIGGSCKLCKNGCAPDRCANPYQSRTPMEALGINIVKSAEQFGIHISFPTKEIMMRIGMLLW